MQRWIVKYFLQARSLQGTRLDLDMPIFCEDQRLLQIVICDVQRRAIEGKVAVSVVANINFLVARITPVIPSEPSTIRNVGSCATLDGHAAVANASPICLNAVLDADLLIDRQPVLVAPEPNHRPVNQLRQLLRWNLIPILKRRVRPVM